MALVVQQGTVVGSTRPRPPEVGLRSATLGLLGMTTYFSGTILDIKQRQNIDGNRVIDLYYPPYLSLLWRIIVQRKQPCATPNVLPVFPGLVFHQLA